MYFYFFIFYAHCEGSKSKKLYQQSLTPIKRPLLLGSRDPLVQRKFYVRNGVLRSILLFYRYMYVLHIRKINFEKNLAVNLKIFCELSPLKPISIVDIRYHHRLSSDSPPIHYLLTPVLVRS